MGLKVAFSRARRGLREDLSLYLVAVSSLTVAFICLAGALLGLTNLASVADRLGEGRRLTVYLVDGAPKSKVQHLQAVLKGLPETLSVEHLTSAAARKRFAKEADLDPVMAALPVDAFPASLEVALSPQVGPTRVKAIAARLDKLGPVEEVETYASWFQSLDSLLSTGKALAWGLTLLVMICVLAVVGNTIRLAIAGRRNEIEVMRLCGATRGFVRGPFVVEGALQGLVAALLAVLVLAVCFALLRTRLDGSLAALFGSHAVFLHPGLLVALLVGGAAVGAAGSAFSLRRYLTV